MSRSPVRFLEAVLVYSSVLATPLALAQSVFEFTIPTRASGPRSIVQGPDGNLWFTESTGNKIGRVATNGLFSEFPLPTLNSFPTGIAVGSDGAIWFTENGTNMIGRITLNGVLTEFPIPSAFPGGGPSDIASGADGALWFTETDGGTGGRIRRVTTAGDFTLFSGQNPSQSPHQIVGGADGNLWYSMPGSGKIGRCATSGVITEFPLPSTDADALALARGPGGNVWIAEHRAGGGKLGRVDASGTITEVSLIPSVTSSMYGLATGPDGNLWFTETDISRIGRATTAGAVDEFIAGGASQPWGITAGPDNAMWFTENLSNKIGRIALAPAGPCTASATTLCLGNGRFSVTTAWRTSSSAGLGQAVSLTSDSGYFWFFAATNVEMIVKVLNGCGVNGHYWVFAGGLTNVEVTMKVTDTQNGTVQTYVNPINTAFQPIQDTSAFATCP